MKFEYVNGRLRVIKVEPLIVELIKTQIRALGSRNGRRVEPGSDFEN